MNMPASYASKHIQHQRNIMLLMAFIPVMVIALTLGTFYFGNHGNDARAATTFRADYENGSFSPWTGGQCLNSWSCTVVNAPAGKGGKVARYEVRDGDCPNTGGVCFGERAERQGGPDTSVGHGSERWYRWQTMFENGFPNSNSWQVVSQWHGISDGSPPIEMKLAGRNLYLNVNQYNNSSTTPASYGPMVWQKTINTGEWIDIRLHIKFQGDSGGYIESWVNGVKMPTWNGKTAKPGEGIYFKQGYYRDQNISGTGIVYYDNTQIATAEVDLGSSTTPTPTPPPPVPTPVPTPAPQPAPTPIPPWSSQTPYGGSARAIPGKIEAEDYDTGGQNVAYYDNTNGNQTAKYRTDDVDVETCSEGGFNIGYNNPGEWREHTVNVQAGIYDIAARVASAVSGGQLVVKLDGQTLGTINVPNTGGWQNYQTVGLNNIALSGGSSKILRFETAGNDYTFNWANFSLVGTPTPTPTPPPSTPPSVPTQPAPPITIPGANPTTPVSIPSALPKEADGSLVADFNGDGLNDVARDLNGDGQIDPTTEIVIDGTTNESLTDTSRTPIDAEELTELYSKRNAKNSNTITFKAGPLPQVTIAKPVAYTFAIAQGVLLTGLAGYLAVTKLAIFAGIRTRLGL